MPENVGFNALKSKWPAASTEADWGTRNVSRRSQTPQAGNTRGRNERKECQLGWTHSQESSNRLPSWQVVLPLYSLRYCSVKQSFKTVVAIVTTNALR